MEKKETISLLDIIEDMIKTQKGYGKSFIGRKIMGWSNGLKVWAYVKYKDEIETEVNQKLSATMDKSKDKPLLKEGKE